MSAKLSETLFAKASTCKLIYTDRIALGSTRDIIADINHRNKISPNVNLQHGSDGLLVSVITPILDCLLCSFFEDDSQASLWGVENKGMKVTADQPISAQISIPSGSQGKRIVFVLEFLEVMGRLSEFQF